MYIPENNLVALFLVQDFVEEVVMADHPIPDITMPVPSDFPSETKSTINGTAETVSKAVENKTGKKGKKEKEKKEKGHTVPFLKLFAFADSLDYLLMIVGSIGAIGNGVAMPLMTLIFGALTNAFGDNQTNTTSLVHEVSKVCGCSLPSYTSSSFFPRRPVF